MLGSVTDPHSSCSFTESIYHARVFSQEEADALAQHFGGGESLSNGLCIRTLDQIFIELVMQS